MLNRVTFILAAVSCALLSAGCAKRIDPAAERNSIRFEAGSLLLNDATKTQSSTKDEFINGDSFSVYGTHNSGGNKTTVFIGDEVTKSTPGWNYANPKSWNWTSTGDWYDFVGIYPHGISSMMAISGNLAVSAHYSLALSDGDNFDLMGAACRRRGSVLDRTATVSMDFAHLTSAVNVVVINNSDNTAVSIDAVKYKNLMVTGDAKVTVDAFGVPLMDWINTERSRGFVNESVFTDKNIAVGKRVSLGYDFMIPQNLDQAAGPSGLDEDKPSLWISYTPNGGSQSTAEIRLKDIERSDGTAITTWESGNIYTYIISLRLNGGLLVTITTTPWGDPIEAQTPGLLIP